MLWRNVLPSYLRSIHPFGMSKIDSPATQHSAADLNHQQQCCWNLRSLTQCTSCFVHFTRTFLLLAISSAHFNYNIQSQIKQTVTEMMPFRSESTTRSTMCLQYKKCLLKEVTKTAKCKNQMYGIYLLIFSSSLCFTTDIQQQTWTVNDTLYTHIQGNGILPFTLCSGTE